MKVKNKVEINDDSILIHTHPTPLLIRILLLTTVSVLFLLPIFGLIAAKTVFNEEINTIGFLVTISISWGSGFYLLRFFLWNTFGYEELSLSEKEIKYSVNFRFFRGSEKSYDISELEISQVKHSRVRNKFALSFTANLEDDSTTIELTDTEFNQIKEKIITRYNIG